MAHEPKALAAPQSDPGLQRHKHRSAWSRLNVQKAKQNKLSPTLRFPSPHALSHNRQQQVAPRQWRWRQQRTWKMARRRMGASPLGSFAMCLKWSNRGSIMSCEADSMGAHRGRPSAVASSQGKSVRGWVILGVCMCVYGCVWVGVRICVCRYVCVGVYGKLLGRVGRGSAWLSEEGDKCTRV